MPRKYIKKGCHTSPDKAGIQNMPENYAEKHHDPNVPKLMEIWNHADKVGYKGQWTDEEFVNEINDFFNYCFANEVKPAKVGLALWLGISKSQYWEWENHFEKYGAKSNLIQRANALIEMQYIGRAESYPTANLFLLQSSHGHKTSQSVDIVNHNATENDINDTLSKLGLLPKSPTNE